jgi:hypothetical protein
MKKIKLLVYALIVCMSFVGVAEAKSRSGSFRSGFSSQQRTIAPAKSSYQTPAANTQTKKTAFGSFGSTNPTLNQKVVDQRVAQVPQSQMSKDLNATAAQSNALKTMDARTKVNGQVNDANSESGWFRRGGQTAKNQQLNASINGNTAAPPVNYPLPPQAYSGSRSSGLLPGLVGFMIGHSLAQPNNVYVPQANQGNNQPQESDISRNNSSNADGAAMQQGQDVPVVETESFFMKLLRVLLWIAMITSVIWLVRKLMNFRARNLHQSANYSLRS